MNKHILFLLLSFIVFVAGNQNKLCEKYDMISTKCGGRHDLCERLQKTNDYEVLITKMCTGKCILEGMGMLHDTKINISKWTKSHAATCDKSRLQEIISITKECTGPEGPSPDVWAKDKCEAVQQIFRCIFKKRAEAKIKPCA